VHVVPGLEQLAAEEILTLPGAGKVVRAVKRFDERTSLLVVEYKGSPDHLLNLRSVEDIFALTVETDDVPASRAGLGAVRSVISGERSLDAAVAAALRVRPRRKGRVSFRVIARKAGQHAFRRVDLQRTVERALLDRYPAWRLVEDNAHLELWVSLVGSLLVVGVRMSDVTMRQRDARAGSGRREHRPAALKPTIAYAMVALSGPRDDDVFLDPMCGSGTILIERAQTCRYRLLLGGDIDPEAVQTTRENVGPRFKPIKIRQWDATSLPLEDRSISALVTNMPFGKQIGSREENRTRYPELLAEWSRILKANGSMVLLTSERALLRQALKDRRELVLARQLPVLVRGVPASIYVLHSAVNRKWGDR